MVQYLLLLQKTQLGSVPTWQFPTTRGPNIFWLPQASGTHEVHTHTHASKRHTHTYKICLKRKKDDKTKKKPFVHVQYRNTFWEGGDSFTKSTSTQLIKEPNQIENKCIILDLKLVQSMSVEP